MISNLLLKHWKGLPLYRASFSSFANPEPSLSVQRNISTRKKPSPILSWKPTRWDKTPAFLKGERGGRKPFMRSIKCNFVLKLTKSYIGHEDNQSFILWNNSHYSPMYYHPYHRKAFRYVLADNYKLISRPSFWQWFWKPFLFFFLFSPLFFLPF